MVNYNSKNVLINILKTVFIAFFISFSLVFMLPDTLTGKVYAETTTTYTQTDEEEEKESPFVHLKEFRFGTGNLVVFLILIGILVGRKVKDYLNEKQKESK